MRDQTESNILELLNSAKEFGENKSEESKEVLDFAVEQTRLTTEQAITNTVNHMKAQKLGLTAKKAIIATQECINAGKKAIEQFPDGHRELENSMFNAEKAADKLKNSTDRFFENPFSEEIFPSLIENAEEFQEPIHRFVNKHCLTHSLFFSGYKNRQTRCLVN